MTVLTWIKGKAKDWLREVLGVNSDVKILRSEIAKLDDHFHTMNLSIAAREAIIKAQEANIKRICEEIKQYARVDADIGIRGNNTIILTGVLKNRAYVKFYDLGDGHFRDLAEQLRDMQKYSLIRNIDRPPMFMGGFDDIFDGSTNRRSRKSI